MVQESWKLQALPTRAAAGGVGQMIIKNIGTWTKLDVHGGSFTVARTVRSHRLLLEIVR